MKKCYAFLTLFFISIGYAQTDLSDLLHSKAITVRSCHYERTDHPLDTALINRGFFVLKRGGSDRLLFTRFGSFALDHDSNIVTRDGHYVQGIDARFGLLHRIQIPRDNLQPQETSKVNLGANLDLRSSIGQNFFATVAIYNSVGEFNILGFEFTRLTPQTWSLKIAINGEAIQETGLLFNKDGTLNLNSKIKNITWVNQNHEQVIELDLSELTQYASPFGIKSWESDGHSTGSLVGLAISDDGAIALRYSNGERKELDATIAVALFEHPEKLDHLVEHLYVRSRASGQEKIYSANSAGSILPGYLQDTYCLPDF